MPISFRARVTTTRAKPIFGRYTPIIQFDLEGVVNITEGTLFDVDWPLVSGKEQTIRIVMYGHPLVGPLAERIAPGTRFDLFEARHPVGSGVVIEVLEATLDE